MAASSSGVYDFNAGENAEQWRGLLQQALRKVRVLGETQGGSLHNYLVCVFFSMVISSK